MRRDRFRPSVHGFHFSGASAEPGTTFGLGTPLLPGFGLSAGMAWLALDRYLAGRPIPSHTDPPTAADELHAALVQRQSNALAAASWSRLIDWQCRPERGRAGRPDLTTSSRAHFRRVQRSLADGVPVLLFLVLARGRHANPSLNRTVLAIGCDVDRSTRRATIQVYDPARPGDDNVRLVLNTARSGALEARLAAETRVHGFFAVPYDRVLPAVLSMSPVAADPPVLETIIAIEADEDAHGPAVILGRGRDGALQQLRRDRRGQWTTESLQKAGSPKTASGETAITAAGPSRIVARSESGDLLDIQRRPALGWRVRNLTSGVDGAFRIDGDPAVLRSAGRLTVVACSQGGLVRYRWTPVRGWSGDAVTASIAARAALTGTPALAERDGLHVLCRTDAGDLIHLREDRKLGWIGTSVTSRPGGRARFVVSDDPLVLDDPGTHRLNVLTRGQDGAVLLFRWTAERGWSGLDLSHAARTAGASLPPATSRLSAAMDHDGTLHVAARDADDGLMHLWCTREGINGGGRIANDGLDGSPSLAAARAGGLLHIFARSGGDLLLFRWTPIAGWSRENLSRDRSLPKIASEPVATASDDALHLAVMGEGGRAHHLCISARPTRRKRAMPVATPMRPAARAPRATPAAVVPKTPPGERRSAAESALRPAPEPPKSAPAAPELRPTSAPLPQRAAMTSAPASAPVAKAVQVSDPQPEFSPPPLFTITPPADGSDEVKPVPHRERPPGDRIPATPALEGLPLLAEDSAAAQPPEPLAARRQTPPRPAPAAPPPPAAADRPKPARSNELEMQRILALAEEHPPRLVSD